jgi:hypothetical protein
MKLSELDFTVEHRAGKKNPHVDALSRHVGAVLDDRNLRREVVRDEQAKDKFCQSLKPGAYQSKREFFIDKGLITAYTTGPTSVSSVEVINTRRNEGESQLVVHCVPGHKTNTQRNCAKLLVARHTQVHRGLCPEVRLLPKKGGGSAVHRTPRITRGT